MSTTPEMNADEKLPPLSTKSVANMMAGIVRRKRAMRTARTLLEDQHFYREEVHWAVVWGLMCDWWDDGELMPGLADMEAGLDQVVEDNPAALTESEYKLIRKFLKQTFRRDIEEFVSKKTLKTLQRFLRERIRSLMQSELDTPNTPVELGGNIKTRIIQLEEVEGITNGRCRRPFEGNKKWKPRGVIKHDTGCAFLNHFLRGGHARGEVQVLIANYGGGKTSLAIQLVVESAKRFWRDWKSGKSKVLRLCYLPFYEGAYEEFQMRLLSYVARIHKNSWEDINDGIELSTSDNLKEYERKMYAEAIAEGEPVAGEQERMEEALKVINRNIILVDCTGLDREHPEQGTGRNGMAQEIASIIRADMKTYQPHEVPGLVVIDHVSAMVERHVTDGPGKRDHLRTLVGKFPIHASNHIAKKFDIPVWIMHQKNTSAQARGPGYIPHHTDSAEAKNFGENADFAFNFGTPDAKGYFVVSCTKHRRQPQVDHIVAKLNGEYGSVIDTRGEYAVDQISNKIVKKSDLKKVSRVHLDAENNGNRPPPADVPGQSPRLEE